MITRILTFLMLFALTAGIIPVSAQYVTLSKSLETADSFISKYPNPDSIHWFTNKNHFDWQAGYMMFTMEKLWKATGNKNYFNYIKRYVDQQVGEDGSVPDFTPDALDHFIPGYAILFLYEQTGLEKYKKAAARIYEGFRNYPRNDDGGFWHSARFRNQMWVDGIFMGQIFMARYAQTISKSRADFDEVALQMKLGIVHCMNGNGLLVHGYDASASARWANKVTGQSPEVWSEGLGWYAVLIADVFDYLPKEHPDYKVLMAYLQKLCKALKNCQDSATGMWCQVVDKPQATNNWNEGSGTGMFLYLLKNSMEKGYISREEFEPVVKKAYAGLITKAVRNDKGQTDIRDLSSIGIKDNYNAYVSQPKEVNTFAGISSFILGTGSMELQKMTQQEAPKGTSNAATSGAETPRLSPVQLPGNGLARFDFFYAGEAKIQNMYRVRNGKIEWSYTYQAPKGEISDAVILSNGNILFAHQFGVTEITPDKKIVWNHDAPEGTEIHTAQPIGKDLVLFLQNGNPAKLLVMNKRTDKMIRELLIPVGNPKQIHGHFRHARLTKAGTILVAHLDMGRLCEYDATGKELMSLDVPGIWSAEELPGGNILITCKTAVFEINRKKERVWEYPLSLAREAGYSITSPQTAVRLSNGNTIVNNWFNQWEGTGQVNPDNEPVQAIEITPDKKIVWALRAWKEPTNLGPSTIIIPLAEPRTTENMFFGDIRP
jgi:rhamnogalacturonyl hydrolase YesR